MTVVGFVSERLLQDIDAFPLNALWDCSGRDRVREKGRERDSMFRIPCGFNTTSNMLNIKFARKMQ